jgi:hypothetical protein
VKPGQGGEQVAGGEVARRAENDEPANHRPCPRIERARFTALEISPTWLNAWG